MYLIIDTETSGLPINFSAPISELNNWPKILWLGYVLLSENFEIIREGNFYINPNENIPNNVTKITNISNEIAKKYGNSISEVLNILKIVSKKAKYLIGHNLEYDYKVISAEIIRNDLRFSLNRKKRICLMKTSKDYVKVKNLNGEIINPKLSELFEKLFSKKFDMKNSFDDIYCAHQCFIKLKEIKII